MINHLGSPSPAKYAAVIQSWAVLHSGGFYLPFTLLIEWKIWFYSAVIVFSAEPTSTLQDINSPFIVSADRGQNHRPDFSLLITMTSHQPLNHIYCPCRFVFVQPDSSDAFLLAALFCLILNSLFTNSRLYTIWFFFFTYFLTWQ